MFSEVESYVQTVPGLPLQEVRSAAFDSSASVALTSLTTSFAVYNPQNLNPSYSTTKASEHLSSPKALAAPLISNPQAAVNVNVEVNNQNCDSLKFGLHENVLREILTLERLKECLGLADKITETHSLTKMTDVSYTNHNHRFILGLEEFLAAKKPGDVTKCLSRNNQKLLYYLTWVSSLRSSEIQFEQSDLAKIKNPIFGPANLNQLSEGYKKWFEKKFSEYNEKIILPDLNIQKLNGSLAIPVISEVQRLKCQLSQNTNQFTHFIKNWVNETINSLYPKISYAKAQINSESLAELNELLHNIVSRKTVQLVYAKFAKLFLLSELTEARSSEEYSLALTNLELLSKIQEPECRRIIEAKLQVYLRKWSSSPEDPANESIERNIFHWVQLRPGPFQLSLMELSPIELIPIAEDRLSSTALNHLKTRINETPDNSISGLSSLAVEFAEFMIIPQLNSFPEGEMETGLTCRRGQFSIHKVDLVLLSSPKHLSSKFLLFSQSVQKLFATLLHELMTGGASSETNPMKAFEMISKNPIQFKANAISWLNSLQEQFK